MKFLRQYGWLLLALGVGAVCRFWDLTGPSLFIDEGFTFHISSFAPRLLLQEVAHADFHPPLFYLLTHELLRLHWQPWNYRYLTALVGLATIAATWGFARKQFGAVAAAFAALFVAVEPNLVEWDRLYRMYAPLVALGAVSWWLLLKACAATGRARLWYWGAYWLCAVLLPYTQYLGILIVFGQSLYALVRWRERWPAFIGFAAALIALVPWAWAIRVQYPNGGEVIPMGSSRFSWPVLVRSLITAGLPASWVLTPHFDQIFMAGTLALVAAGTYLGRRSALVFWLAPAALQVVVAVISGKDIIIPRHLLMYLPAIAVCAAVVVSALLQTRWRIAGVAVALCWFGIGAVSIADTTFDKFYQFPDWYAINILLLQKEQRHDLIVMDQGAEYWVVHDYTGFRGHQMDAPALPTDIDSDIRWLRGYPTRRVWYIENQPFFTDNARRLQADLERTRPRLGAWIQPHVFEEDVVRVVLYGPRLPAGRSKARTPSARLPGTSLLAASAGSCGWTRRRASSLRPTSRSGPRIGTAIDT